MSHGNVLIGQSGGPTSVINASLAGVAARAIEKLPGAKVLGMRYGIAGFMKDEWVDLSAQPKSLWQGLRTTPGSVLGSSRHKVKEEDFPVILAQLKKHQIRYFFLIGGNDTMDTIHRVEAYCRAQKYDLCGIGVPKTVDNDLFGTDHTPGFPSAARFNALSARQAGRLARDMKRVDQYLITQSIGRDAGFLTAAGALGRQKAGDPPHLIYVPERKLNRDRFLARVEAVIKEQGFVTMMVSEGLHWDDGKPVSESQTKDRFGNLEYGAMGGGSVALSLHRLIKEHTGFRGEFQITESLPMSSADRAAPNDVEEAWQCGSRAVDLALAGKSGVMVTITRIANAPYQAGYGEIPLNEVAVRAKPMPDAFINAAGDDVTQAFMDYAAPLVGPLPELADLS